MEAWRGQPRNRWIMELLARTGMGLEELREDVRNQSARRPLTMTVARIQRVDDTRGDVDCKV